MNELSQLRARILPTTAEERAQIVEMLRDATGEYEGDDVFVFPGEISSDRLDSYYSHMAPSTLRNFAADAREGVSLQDSHNHRQLGYGRSITGIVEDNGENMRTVVNFYTVRGINFGGDLSYRSTDDFIRAVETGLAQDLSVGFYGGRDICDICGEPMWGRTDCPHFPGLEYPIGEQGNDTVIATYTIEDAHLAEVSVVYDGATPEAMILKAQRLAAEGLLDSKQLKTLERRYRFKTADFGREIKGAPLPKKEERTEPDDEAGRDNHSDGGNTMSDETMERGQVPEEQPVPADPSPETPDSGRANELDQLRAVLAETPAPEGELEAGVRWLANELATVRQSLNEANAEVEQLRPLADDGRAYRADLIAEALAEGVRALGEGFAQETYRGILNDLPLNVIKRMRDDWTAIGSQRFGPGRQTTDEGGDEPQEEQPKSRVPEAAYE